MTWKGALALPNISTQPVTPHACSPGREVLWDMPMQLLSCKHSSSHSRMEHFGVIPKGTVTKEKD